MGGLLAHAQRGADLGPGPSAAPALIDEVAEEGVADRFELGHGSGRLGNLVERVAAGGGSPNRLDEFREAGWSCHASTIG